MTCIEKTKFDAKIRLFRDILFVLLQSPQKVYFFRAPSCEHIECGDAHANIYSENFEEI